MTLNKADLITTRFAVPEDRNFIFATWLRGLKYGNDYFNLIDKDIYFKRYHQVLEHILTSGVQINVACLKEDQSVILGYSVYKGDTLHWVFVKSAWRHIGIAKSLYPAETKKVTHLTKTGVKLFETKLKELNVIFDPFAL